MSVFDPNKPFSYKTRVYYEDTDAAGVVYHANYLHFTERARTEWLRAMGKDHKTLREDGNVVFVVKKLDIHYKHPARLDDPLEIMTSITAKSAATLDMEQIILHEDTQRPLAIMHVQLVGLSREGKVVRLPDWIPPLTPSNE